MSLAVLGLLHHAHSTEFRPAKLRFDPEHIRLHAQLYDQYDYDRILIGQNARSPDPLSIASYISAYTKNLKFMIAHRPGFIAPTMAARMFATVDRLSGGRCAAHIITAASDIETQCDGDFLTKEERYERSREYVGIMKEIWTSPTPVDHEGEFYSFKQGFSDVKPSQKPVPIFWGGSSAGGIEGAAQCADVYALGGGTIERTAALVSEVRAAAEKHSRSLSGFCMSMRIIMAPTEEEAWEKARTILDAITDFQAKGGVIGRDKGSASERILAEAEEAMTRPPDGPDRHLWAGLAVATKGRTHITALVGSIDQLSEALLRYYDVGINNFILTGFEPLEDTVAIGRDLIPRLKAGASRRDMAGQ